MNRLDRAFARLRAADELGLFPYLMTGFPDPLSCSAILNCLAENGADGIELGVPFSDPLADGATFQRVGALAREQGASLEMALDEVRRFRATRDIPVLLMTYYNILLAYGLSEVARDGAAAGVDGLIVPDLPIEEAGEAQKIWGAEGLHLISLLAPTSTDARLAQTAERASGFVYCVSLLGVTGARDDLAEELPVFLRRVRQRCKQPLVVGFGISRPEHVRAVRGQADGVIVASALAGLIESSPPQERLAAVSSYIRELKAATRAPAPSGSNPG